MINSHLLMRNKNNNNKKCNVKYANLIQINKQTFNNKKQNPKRRVKNTLVIEYLDIY